MRLLQMLEQIFAIRDLTNRLDAGAMPDAELLTRAGLDGMEAECFRPLQKTTDIDVSQPNDAAADDTDRGAMEQITHTTLTSSPALNPS